MKTVSFAVLLNVIALQTRNSFCTKGVVNVDCAYSSESAKISYVGDPVAVVALDADGESFYFDEDIATATYSKVVPFNSTDSISFKKKEGLDSYTLNVMSRKTYKEYESNEDEDYSIECTFARYKNDVRGNITLEEETEETAQAGPPPIITQSEKGTKSVSVIKLGLAKVDGSDYTGSVSVGRLVRLKAVLTPAGADVGFRVSSCTAASEDGSRKGTIIAMGCGTGSIFRTSAGFDITGLEGLTPVFRMFSMRFRQGVIFDCKYTMCSTNCDGMIIPNRRHSAIY